MKNPTISFLLLLVWVAISCQVDVKNSENSDEILLKEAKALHESFKGHLIAADTIALFDFLEYTYIEQGSELVTPDGEIIRKEALMPFYRGAMGQGFKYFDVEIRFFDEQFTASGIIVLHRYSYELKFTPKQGGEMFSEAGSGIKVYKRGEDGKVRMLYDVWGVNP